MGEVNWVSSRCERRVPRKNDNRLRELFADGKSLLHAPHARTHCKASRTMEGFDGKKCLESCSGLSEAALRE